MPRKPAQDIVYPSAPEAEAQLLGCLLNYPSRLDDALAILTGGATEFYGDQHRAIFNAMVALATHGPGVDVDVVITYLRAKGQLDDADGNSGPYSAAYVRLLAREALDVSPDWMGLYATSVHDCAQRRADIAAAAGIIQAAQHENESYTVTRAAYLDGMVANSASVEDDTLPLLTASEAEAQPALKGILGDLLHDDSVAFLYGPSGRWKSFIALDWALSLATGQAWMGRAVEQGDVLYVCSEGARGIGKRITAWKKRHAASAADADHLYILPLAIDLAQPAQVARLLRRLEASEVYPQLIVFDTLAASNSGDENDQQNARNIVDAARRISRATDDACVLIVHHTGYDTSHMRGATGLFSGADIVIRVEGGDANKRIEPGEPVRLVSHKPKEGEPFQDITLTADVERWATTDNAICSSLVMVPCDAPVRADDRTKGLTTKRRGALDALPPEGLHFADYYRVSGISNRTAFNEFLTWAIDRKLMERAEDGKYCPLVGTVGTVRYGLSETAHG